MLRGELLRRADRGLLVLGSSYPVERMGTSERTDRGEASRVLVLPGTEGFHAVNVSWTGDNGCAESQRLPLDAIHMTTAAHAVSLARLEPDEAVEALLSYAVMPLHDSVFPSRVFDAAVAITHAVTVVQLGFPKRARTRPLSWEHGGVGAAATLPYSG